MGSEAWNRYPFNLGLESTNSHHPRTIDQATGRRLASVGEDVLGSPSHQLGSFLKDPWIVLGNNFTDVSNLNIIVYEFDTSHINVIQNEHVKLDETCLDTRGHFQARLSNIMDVLGRLTSKLNETRHTNYK